MKNLVKAVLFYFQQSSKSKSSILQKSKITKLKTIDNQLIIDSKGTDRRRWQAWWTPVIIRYDRTPLTEEAAAITTTKLCAMKRTMDQTRLWQSWTKPENYLPSRTDKNTKSVCWPSRLPLIMPNQHVFLLYFVQDSGEFLSSQVTLLVVSTRLDSSDICFLLYNILNWERKVYVRI